MAEAYLTRRGRVVTTRTVNIRDEVNYGDPITITFEEGMTWGQWIFSEYNTVGAIIRVSDYDFNYSAVIINDSHFRGGDMSLTVYVSNVIDAESDYYFADW